MNTTIASAAEQEMTKTTRIKVKIITFDTQKLKNITPPFLLENVNQTEI
jgi:hypothetical protein